MTKRFCDMCGKPAKETSRLEHQRTPNPRPEGSDKTARIEVRINFGFITHSTGFGGPPDLCKKCQELLIEELLAVKF